ncbi:MAG: 4Fe-4S binding protein [Deltaproteobacteria bacterium]|nr:4Fe-4S binding protein [Deltaproteobacteria bacterium]
MSDAIYRKLATVLDTLPNGFPAAESGVEIKLLKKIFPPEDAELFCDLRLSFETVEAIAERTGRPLAGLKWHLIRMARSGQIFTVKLGRDRYFKMLPWVFGIYELQCATMDREFAELHAEYEPIYGRQFFTQMPQLMQTLPVEGEIPEQETALPYEKLSTLIEQSQSFLLNDCVCKKEQALLNHPCDRPLQVCLTIAPLPGIFDNSPQGKVISRTEAYELLKMTEEAGLVHLTSNVRNGAFYICNCCKCCCGVLSAINKLGIPAAQAVNSHYFARIDPEKCSGCGLCVDERCQVAAIEAEGDTYRIVEERCIGCGLCATTCPSQAVGLIHKDRSAVATPPLTEEAWFAERGRNRGVDFSAFK